MVDEVRNAILGARAAQIQLIQKSFSNAEEVAKDEDNVAKAEKEDELFLKATELEKPELDSDKDKKGDNNEGDEEVEEAQQTDVEKSDIAEALSGHNGLKIKKTGKEIKDHLKEVVIPELTATLATKEALATQLLANCGDAPTKEPDCWWTDGIKMDCGYKVYDWHELECCNNDGRIMYATLSATDAAEKRGNCPENCEQAQSRRDYNEAVRAICNIKVDLKACEVMDGLKDAEDYELNPRQIIALKF